LILLALGFEFLINHYQAFRERTIAAINAKNTNN
jgi:hypothetical protein